MSLRDWLTRRKPGRDLSVHCRLEMVTRENCHLCEEMATVLDRELPQLGASYVKVDVDADADLKQRYGDTVPVLLRDGRIVAKVRLKAEQVERIVRRRR